MTSSVRLNLREMLDIALPAPCMEVINFHILHKLLAAMIEALQMDEMQVNLSSSSLISTKDEGTEPAQMSDRNSENEMEKRDEDDDDVDDNGHDDAGKNKNYYYYNRPPNQSERNDNEAAECMAKKLSEMDTQITCLNDYVSQCMRAISASTGLKNLPRPSATEAEMAVENILCEIIESTDTVPAETPKTMSDRLTELENDQLKQWDDVTALSTSFGKYAEETDALIENVKSLQCKSKQMLEEYTRFAANTQTTFESQDKINESMEKKIKAVSTGLTREKNLTNCSLKNMEGTLEQKVDRYDLECVKDFVKSKVKEVKMPLNSRSKKIIDEITNGPVLGNRNAVDGGTMSKPTVVDQINQQWVAHRNAMTMLNEKDMSACVCSFVKGTNGSVYKSNCVCCKQKTNDLPNT